MPSAGGFSQTAVNLGAGAQTQLSELVTVLLAVGCALVLGPVLGNLPQATLGAMVFVAVIGLIKPAELVRFWRLSRTEFWLVVITAAAGLGFGLLPAVFVGVLSTLFLVLRELDRSGLTELQLTTDGADLRVAGSHTDAIPGLLALRLDGPLYTANVRSVNRKMLDAVDERAGVEVLVLDTAAQGLLSITVIDEVGMLEHELAARGVQLWVAELPPRALATARLTPRWQELVDDGRLFPTTLGAVKAYRDAHRSDG